MDIKKDINFENLTNDEILYIQSLCSSEIDKRRDVAVKEINYRYRKFVGRYYMYHPEQDEKCMYIRIIRPMMHGYFDLGGIAFSLPIKLSKYYEGICYQDFHMIDKLPSGEIMVDTDFKEISEEEYFSKMDEYIAELRQKLKDGFFDETIA